MYNNIGYIQQYTKTSNTYNNIMQLFIYNLQATYTYYILYTHTIYIIVKFIIDTD